MLFLLLLCQGLTTVVVQAEEPQVSLPWQVDSTAERVFAIRGTGARSNPVRTRLTKPFSGDELFVRFRLRYRGETVDTPVTDEGEFFVLWLDDQGGNASSTHSAGVPNVGIHVDGRKNRFMVRYASRAEKFAAELTGDRDYQIVARLWKSAPGAKQPFDQLDLWVNPQAEAELKPDASVASRKAVSQIAWIGFSTGMKTEPEDYISVWDTRLATSWREILDLPETAPGASPPPQAVPRTVNFDQQVYPILKAKCFACHAGEDAEIRLDIHDELLNHTKLYNAAQSHLIQKITSGEMPPEDEPQLTAAEITTLRTWINEGLIWNDKLLPPPQPQTQHWSFQPVVRPEIPRVKNNGWVRTAVDAFIARKQEAAGVTPAPAADAVTLSRRMSLDLLGLPPAEPETGAAAEEPAVTDNAAAVADSMVDRLLQDPAYGRRWGRHWLDVARWAESNGHQHNRARPHAWRYRDWVVEAFNRDLPYDEFLAAQVAGDELPRRRPDENGRLIATGFLAAARYSGNELDKRIQRNDILVDVVNVTTNAFLGLTFECAQCHTHKFDPISLRDYYQMQAFFAKGQPANISLAATGPVAATATPNPDTKSSSAQSPSAQSPRDAIRERWEIFDRTYQRLVNVRKRQGNPAPALVLPRTVISRISGDDKQRFQRLEKQISGLPKTWGFYAPSSAIEQRAVAPHVMRWPLPHAPETLANVTTHMLLRGDINSPGPAVQPGWPLVFGPTGDLGKHPRTALARWMTSRNNPLTARVWVNRIWHWHFGRGLVSTTGDFGKQGVEPTHPELLDFLAAELMDNGWSTQHIHRLIMNSATYRQSSQHSAANAALDPADTTYWRWRPRRLEAEAIRDCMLAVSGQLDTRAGGPSDAENSGSKRQSLYLTQRRQTLPHQQMLFDGAGAVVSCSHRRTSTNALQPLWLLNSKFAQQAATALAKRAGSAEAAFTLCLRRKPSAAELKAVNTHAGQHGLVSACLVLLNTSEFLYIP